MWLAFGAGLFIGTIGGMASWLAAAAYLEAKRARLELAANARPAATAFAETVQADADNDWAPRIRGRRTRRTVAPVSKGQPGSPRRASTI